MSESVRYCAFVPTVRPALMIRLLETWPLIPSLEPFHLYVNVQDYTESMMEEIAHLLPERHTIIWPGKRCAPWRARNDCMWENGTPNTVWLHLDDDMEFIPDLTDYTAPLDRIHDPRIGVISCNWARSEKLLYTRMPKNTDADWIKQPLVNMAGGMLYRQDVALTHDRSKDYIFDDIQAGLDAYLAGYENWRYRGSVLIHRIGASGGLRDPLPGLSPPNPRYIVVRTGIASNTAGFHYRMPVNSDLTRYAHDLHKAVKR